MTRAAFGVKIALCAFIFAAFLLSVSVVYTEFFERGQMRAQCEAFGGKVLTLKGDFICLHDFTRPSPEG